MVHKAGVLAIVAAAWWTPAIPNTPSESTALVDVAPSAFSKISPGDRSTGNQNVLTLSWSPSVGATGYEYCIDRVENLPLFNQTCDTVWVQTTATTVTVSNLFLGGAYLWQVRALNGAGATEANDGRWFRFQTKYPAGVYLSDDFEVWFNWVLYEQNFYPSTETAHSGTTSWRSYPNVYPAGTTGLYLNKSLDLTRAVNPELRFWHRRGFRGQSRGVVRMVRDGDFAGTTLATYFGADSQWTESRIDLSAFVGGRYYLEFVASFVSTGDDPWFIDDVIVSGAPVPGGFKKITRNEIATQQLAWEPSEAATSYEVCYDRVDNNQCDTAWASTGLRTTLSVDRGSPGTTYYWQVRAINSLGTTDADDGVWGKFRAAATSPFDVNGDGSTDLFWLHDGTRQLAVWYMGAGSLGERLFDAELLTAPALPAGWRVVGSADADGDRKLDLFLQSDTGLLAVWFFSGKAFRNGVLLNAGAVSDPAWRVRAVGDFNRDGHPDLVWQYGPTGQIAFWLLNGINVIGYAVPSVAAPGADWQVFGAGDANRDGQLDLFFQHRANGWLAVWWMSGTDFASGGLLSSSPADPGWQAMSACDLDLDGSPDIVFQHQTSNMLGAWYLTGQTVRFGLLLSPSNAGDPNWKVVAPH